MKQLVLASAAILALAAGSVSAAPTASVKGKASNDVIAAKGGACGNTGADSGQGIFSGTLGSGYEVYASQGAADCVLKKKATVSSVTIAGQYFNGSGPADSFGVAFYKNKKGVPSKAIKAYTALSYTNSGSSFTIAFPATKLKGTVWVSVTGNTQYANGAGEFGWDISSSQVGAADLWENAGGGFGICPKWDTVLNCIGVSGDYIYSLS
jgi:hypothetical protein